MGVWGGGFKPVDSLSSCIHSNTEIIIGDCGVRNMCPNASGGGVMEIGCATAASAQRAVPPDSLFLEENPHVGIL